ncbi:MAG: c-type cytochrome domain-containing protein [Planctomycetaceae bacterium]
MRWFLPFLLIASALADDSTAIQPVDPALGHKVEFYQDLFPVLESKCLACHNLKTKEGSLVLENVPGILAGGDSGPAVVAGKPEESLLYKLAARADEPVMPPLPNSAQAKPLSPRELGILKQWILEGATPGSPPPASTLNWQPVPEQIHSVQTVALDNRSRFLAAGRANRVVLFDLTEHREIAQLTDPSLLTIQSDGKPMYGQGIAHRDFVHAVAFSPDGSLLASAGYRVVKLWERVHETRLADWDAGAAVTSLTVSADGVLAATGLADGTVKLWDLSTGQPGATLSGHSASVGGVAFSPDATVLYSGSDDKTLRCWSVGAGKELGQVATPTECKAVVISRDAGLVVSAQQDNKLLVWDKSVFLAMDPPATEPAKPVREVGGLSQPVTSMVWVPSTDEFLTACRDGSVRSVNVTNGSISRTFALGAPVLDVAVSDDGKRVAGSGENGVTRVWQRDNGQQLAEIKGNPVAADQVLALTAEQTVAKLKVGLRDEAEKDADKDLKGREDSLKKANEQKEAAVKGVDDPTKKLAEADQQAQAAAKALEAKQDDEALKKAKEAADKAKSDAGEALKKAQATVTSAERAVKLSEESLERAKQTQSNAKQAHEAAKAYNSQVDEQLKQAQTTAAQLPGAQRGVGFSPSGGQLVTGGDGGRLDLWTAATGVALDSLATEGNVNFVRFTSNGSLVTAGGQRLTVRDVRPQWKIIARLGCPEDAPLDVSKSPMVDRVLALAFSPDGKQLATGGGDPSRSGELLLWDIASRRVAHEYKEAHSDTVFDVEFSRDGKRLVSGAADKFVKLFNAETGEFIRGFEGHTNHVLAVSIKCDDSSIASGGADNAIKVWNTDTGEQRRTMTQYAKQVTSLDYIGVSDNFVSSGGDKTVRLYTAGNGSNFRTLSGMPDYVYDSTASADQQLVIGAGEDGVIHVWDGQKGNELMKFDPPAVDAPAATAGK